MLCKCEYEKKHRKYGRVRILPDMTLPILASGSCHLTVPAISKYAVTILSVTNNANRQFQSAVTQRSREGNTILIKSAQNRSQAFATLCFCVHFADPSRLISVQAARHWGHPILESTAHQKLDAMCTKDQA